MTMLGRGSQSINSGGEKIYPEEVEAALKATRTCSTHWWSACPTRASVSAWPPSCSRAKAPADAGRTGQFVRSEIAGYKVPRTLVGRRGFSAPGR